MDISRCIIGKNTQKMDTETFCHLVSILINQLNDSVVPIDSWISAVPWVHHCRVAAWRWQLGDGMKGSSKGRLFADFLLV